MLEKEWFVCFYPFYILYPENWKRGLCHARVRMMSLLNHGMTPVEALDYWALKSGFGWLQSNQAQNRWRAARDVAREATNKTIWQAREKFGDEDAWPYYPEQNSETRSVEQDR